jgi:hypothetical protein
MSIDTTTTFPISERLAARAVAEGTKAARDALAPEIGQPCRISAAIIDEARWQVGQVGTYRLLDGPDPLARYYVTFPAHVKDGRDDAAAGGATLYALARCSGSDYGTDEYGTWAYAVEPITADDATAPIDEPEKEFTFDELKSEHAMLKNELAGVNADRDLAVTRLEAAQSAGRRAERELDSFKTLVRDTAIEYQQEHSSSICEDGLNEFLDALGLDPVSQPLEEFEVTVKFIVRARKTERGDTEDTTFLERSISADLNVDSDWDDVEVIGTDIESVECTGTVDE